MLSTVHYLLGIYSARCEDPGYNGACNQECKSWVLELSEENLCATEGLLR
jgi:hypothetical protein